MLLVSAIVTYGTNGPRNTLLRMISVLTFLVGYGTDPFAFVTLDGSFLCLLF